MTQHGVIWTLVMTSLKLNYTKVLAWFHSDVDSEIIQKWLFHVSVKHCMHFKRIWFIIQGLSQHPRQYELSSVNIWNEDIIKKSLDCAWPDWNVYTLHFPTTVVLYYQGANSSGVKKMTNWPPSTQSTRTHTHTIHTKGLRCLIVVKLLHELRANKAL